MDVRNRRGIKFKAARTDEVLQVLASPSHVALCLRPVSSTRPVRSTSSMLAGSTNIPSAGAFCRVVPVQTTLRTSLDGCMRQLLNQLAAL